MKQSTLLQVSFLLVRLGYGFNCSITPIYVDIHKRAVHGSSIFQYGAFIGVGTPAQNQSIWPSLRHNETSFASSDFCSNSNLTDCIDSTGGNVQFNLSSTWNQSSNYHDTDLQNAFASGVAGTDNLHLYTHFFETDPAFEHVVPGSDVEFANSGYISPGIVGFGSSSTLLQRLYDLGLITARMYSLYIGSGMDRAAGVVNGSNVLGGYDSGRFTAPVHTYDMDLSSEDFLPVTVSNIVLDDPSNASLRNVSIMNNTAPFTAKITTDQYPLTLPYAITQSFISHTSAIPSNNTDGSLQIPTPTTFNGSLSFTLSDNFTITLPPEVVSNVSGLTPIAANDQPDDANTTFYLSVAWLSQVYLMLDYESSKFHLAQVIPKNAYVMPQPWCPSSTPIPYDYGNPNPNASPFWAKGLIGAVIGGTIGGLAVFTAVVSLFVFWKGHRYGVLQERQWVAREKSMKVKLQLNGSDIEMSPLREKEEDIVYPEVLAPAPYRPRSGISDLSEDPRYEPYRQNI